MIKTLNTLFVTMCGLGKVPKIPGTFGSLATVIILYFFSCIKLNYKSYIDWFDNNLYFIFFISCISYQR